MKRMLMLLAVLVAGFVLGSIGQIKLKQEPVEDRPVATMSAGPTLEAVQSLASLVTTKVTVSDVQLTELQGYVGGARAALLVRGDFTLGTDLTRARFATVDQDKRSVVITLLRPVGNAPRIDLSRTRLVSVSTTGVWDIVPGHDAETTVVDQAYREAQGILLKASEEAVWGDQAERQAERVIKTFFTSFGWSAEVRWVND